MGFKINTNVSSLYTNLSLQNNQKALDRTLAMLASGDALANAANDAAGLAISDGLSAQVSGYGQAMMNINDGIGLVQTADGAVQGLNDNLNRIRTLTLQASNGTLNDSDRAIIQKEIDGVLKSMDSIVQGTSFNGKNLLDGSESLTLQIGANSGETQSLNIPDMSSASLVGSIDITTAVGRSNALDSIDSAMEQISSTQATLGASQNQLESTFRNVSQSQINIASAESQIRDVDFAKESMNFSQQNIMSQAGSFAQAQTNTSLASVMRLLQ
ncbi:flagellin [Sulfurimonas microaerophilic]|uniref:flagellin N-terminal helical domain-containing protein n=1 Tax=Sulfurimonas microaerophilic TaxID=3058392 RepID=UPI002715581F|nr:flagellin [Sulfurimonas sp. hsl 1-7]